jgi:hypothetical protein
MVKRALQDNEGIVVELQGTKEHMLLTPEVLRNDKFQINRRKYKSKFDGNEYELIDFVWKPENI